MDQKAADSARAALAYRALAAALLKRLGQHPDTQRVLAHWAETGALLQVPRGGIVFRHGDPGCGLLLVVEGAVAVGRHLDDKPSHVCVYLGPGELYGLVSVTDGGSQAHDMRAHEDSVLLMVPAALVVATMRRLPRVADALLLDLAGRSRALYERLVDTVSRPLVCRLARQLHDLGMRFGRQRPEGLILTLRLSQSDLAALLGAGRQQINTELKKLQQRGVIRVSRTAVTIVDPPGLAEFARIEPAAAGSARLGELRGTHLLVVDDDAVYRLLLATWLQQAGAHVEEATDGLHAVARASRTPLPYDAILMDDKMPELSGAEAARHIRAHERANGGSTTPILCISSASTRRDAERYLAAGMTAFVPKPSEPGALLQALRPLIVA
jgi:CRP/FNR family cyclic AMP-dependent transcriptional regulator